MAIILHENTKIQHKVTKECNVPEITLSLSKQKKKTEYFRFKKVKISTRKYRKKQEKASLELIGSRLNFKSSRPFKKCI